MNINYLKGDATTPIIAGGSRFIVHVCNDRGGWGAGFVMALSRRWPEPEAAYRRWHRDGVAPAMYSDFKLGQFDVVEIPRTEGLHVVNVIAQEGYGEDGKPPIRYKHLEDALARLAIYTTGYQDVSFHLPRIGCGLAGGSWDEVGPIIERTLGNSNPVYVYDF